MKLKEKLRELFDPPIAAMIWQLLDQARTLGFGDEDFVNAKEALEANEWELSFDTIVTQIDEYGIPVTTEFIGRSENIIAEMKIDRSKYQFIYRLPINGSRG